MKSSARSALSFSSVSSLPSGEKIGPLLERAERVEDLVLPAQLAQAVVLAEEVGLLRELGVVVEDERVRVERDRVLLALELPALPDRRLELVGRDPVLLEQVGRELHYEAGGRERPEAGGVRDRHVGRASADRGELQLRVVRRPPGERDRLDLDVGAGLAERVEHLRHALAVAAGEQVPEGDRASAAAERRAGCGDDAGGAEAERGRARDQPPPGEHRVISHRACAPPSTSPSPLPALPPYCPEGPRC